MLIQVSFFRYLLRLHQELLPQGPESRANVLHPNDMVKSVQLPSAGLFSP